MKTKFDICDSVVFLNTTTGRFDTAEVKGIRIVATGMHADENGDNVLDAAVVLYETNGPMVAEPEAFASVDEAKAYWLEKLQSL